MEYGYSKERMIYIVRKGITGAQEIESLMHTYRHKRPNSINNSKIISVKDYLSRKETNLISGEESNLDFETTANVLQFYLEDGSKISVRPSGTEPKIKYYFEVREELDCIDEFEVVNKKADQKIESIIRDMELN